MDHFGIGTAVRGMFDGYCRGARRTGRTTSLVESVKDGDRIIFAVAREAQRVQRLCVERGVDVECRVLPPEHFYKAPELGTGRGRTIFDHEWVVRYHAIAIERAIGGVDEMEQRLSGDGAAHRETRRQAIELSKWQG